MEKKLEQQEETVFPRQDVIDRQTEECIKKLNLNRLSVRSQLRAGGSSSPKYGLPSSGF